MSRVYVADGRWACNGWVRRRREELGASGSGRRGGAEEVAGSEEVAGPDGGGQEKSWRGQSRGSPQQLAERYADLAASHREALRQREEEEWENVELRVENLRLRLQNRRLRWENCCLVQQILPGLGPDEPSPAADPAEEAEALRAQLAWLQEEHRRALLHLRRCRAAGGTEASELEDGELDEQPEEDEQPKEGEQPKEDEQPLKIRSLPPPLEGVLAGQDCCECAVLRALGRGRGSVSRPCSHHRPL